MTLREAFMVATGAIEREVGCRFAPGAALRAAVASRSAQTTMEFLDRMEDSLSKDEIYCPSQGIGV